MEKALQSLAYFFVWLDPDEGWLPWFEHNQGLLSVLALALTAAALWWEFRQARQAERDAAKARSEAEAKDRQALLTSRKKEREDRVARERDEIASYCFTVNQTKAKVWDAYVEPFGQAQVFGTASANIDLRLPGQWAQMESGGLSQNWNRDYDPTLARYIQSDPIGLDGGQNLYAYVDGQPLTYIDVQGLDIWIEGPAGVEPSLHQSLNVGYPNGQYTSYSFGLNGNGIQGGVYDDWEHGGRIEKFKKTTPLQDWEFKKKLDAQMSRTGTYGVDDTCRTWTQRWFDLAPGTLMTPPQRTPRRHRWSPLISSAPSSSSGTSTSK